MTVGNYQALCYHCFILSLIFVHVYFLLLEFNNGDHPKKKKEREREVTVDLPGKNYCFPQDVTTTDSRPDLVIWKKKSIYLIELTVPFDTGFEAAVQRKQGRYGDLLAQCATKRTAYMTTLEIGSRGFINTKGFDIFNNHLTPSTKKAGVERAGEGDCGKVSCTL